MEAASRLFGSWWNHYGGTSPVQKGTWHLTQPPEITSTYLTNIHTIRCIYPQLHQMIRHSFHYKLTISILLTVRTLSSKVATDVEHGITWRCAMKKRLRPNDKLLQWPTMYENLWLIPLHVTLRINARAPIPYPSSSDNFTNSFCHACLQHLFVNACNLYNS